MNFNVIYSIHGPVFSSSNYKVEGKNMQKNAKNKFFYMLLQIFAQKFVSFTPKLIWFPEFRKQNLLYALCTNIPSTSKKINFLKAWGGMIHHWFKIKATKSLIHDERRKTCLQHRNCKCGNDFYSFETSLTYSIRL